MNRPHPPLAKLPVGVRVALCKRQPAEGAGYYRFQFRTTQDWAELINTPQALRASSPQGEPPLEAER